MGDNSKYEKLTNSIKEFVVSVDKDNKLILIDKDLFYSKFDDYSASNEIFFKLIEIRRLVKNNLLSENYLNEEWGGIQNFKKFIDETYEEIVSIIDTIWINEINSYVLSERPIGEKIDHLTREISDLEGVQFFGGNEFVKRKKYLKTKIDELELKIKTLNANPITKSGQEILLDFSDNSKVEKIVFLYELGILDYLQKKMIDELHGFSANKLAEIISTFTGIEQKTAQSYLNPMFTKDAIQKNNPLTKINLEKVNNKMKDIGFNTLKSV